jgi:NAD(P)-dependent dehydrogenase (short-subunit alcohol dehydrogenase family)
MSLAGQHAIVTGGGTGIGLAIARALSGEGATVTITGRRKDRLDAAADHIPGLFPLVMDVQDEISVQSGFEQAADRHGPVAICVANAGIAEGRAVHKMDLDFWRNIMATNLDGAFLTLREALKTMRTLPRGRIIGVSSIAGLRGLKGAAAYSASKHGLMGLIRTMAEDYVGSGITFNALCPAYVDTDIIGQNIASIQKRSGMTEEAALNITVSANPHGRLIHPEEVAAAALWLCNPAADSVNGQGIEISGGPM